MHDDTGIAEVIVPDFQLSLAIGKEGQNARLAARLTGWRVDIKSETQLAEEESGSGYAEGEWVEGPDGGLTPGSRPGRRSDQRAETRVRNARRRSPARLPTRRAPRPPTRPPVSDAPAVAEGTEATGAPKGAAEPAAGEPAAAETTTTEES